MESETILIICSMRKQTKNAKSNVQTQTHFESHEAKAQQRFSATVLSRLWEWSKQNHSNCLIRRWKTNEMRTMQNECVQARGEIGGECVLKIEHERSPIERSRPRMLWQPASNHLLVEMMCITSCAIDKNSRVYSEQNQ